MAEPPTFTPEGEGLRKLLARHDAYKEDVKNLGPRMADIKFSLADLIDGAGKHWCGNWSKRECHQGGRLGDKCHGHNCGSYMTTHYDSDPNGKAKFEEWFANDPDCDLVLKVGSMDSWTYEKRKKWW